MDKISKLQLIQSLLEQDELDLEDEDVSQLLVSNTISRDTSREYKDEFSFGDRMADKLATFAGSWKFIFGFIFVLVAWIISNIIMLSSAFDPYPFILLNLVLSCIGCYSGAYYNDEPEQAGSKRQTEIKKTIIK